jgi:hypothetical protein
MGETLVLVDGEGELYAFDSAVLAAGGDLTAEQVDAARLSQESSAAVQMALGYERVGRACGPVGPTDEIVLGRNPARRFVVLGSIGAL